jgi:hypothetical protein
MLSPNVHRGLGRKGAEGSARLPVSSLRDIHIWQPEALTMGPAPTTLAANRHKVR